MLNLLNTATSSFIDNDEKNKQCGRVNIGLIDKISYEVVDLHRILEKCFHK